MDGVAVCRAGSLDQSRARAGVQASSESLMQPSEESVSPKPARSKENRGVKKKRTSKRDESQATVAEPSNQVDTEAPKSTPSGSGGKWVHVPA